MSRKADGSHAGCNLPDRPKRRVRDVRDSGNKEGSQTLLSGFSSASGKRRFHWIRWHAHSYSSAFLAAIAVGAGATAAVYTAVNHDSTKTVVREVTVESATPAVNESGGLSVAQIYQAAHKGVVEITIELNGGGAQGSGWVYADSAGHVVTNDHVVDGASSIEVTFSDAPAIRPRSSETIPRPTWP